MLTALFLASCGNGSSSSSAGGGGGGGGANDARNLACTYFGGQHGGVGNDRAQGLCVVPGTENVVICGNTTADDFAGLYPGVPGWHHTLAGDSDAFVAILSKDLHSILAWTYIGGSHEDRAYGVALDAQGKIWVSGFSKSSDFPNVAGVGHHGAAGTMDAFVARFTANLGSCEFARCLGGTGDESPRATFALTSSGEVYLAGKTTSTDFPVGADAGQTLFDATANGGHDAWVAKLGPTGDVVWATYFGGADEDGGWSGLGLAPDEQSLYCAGFTRSTTAAGFPAQNAFDTTYNGDEGPSEPSLGDAWVARFSSTGALLACTYLGGTSGESVSPNRGLCVAPDGSVAIVGMSRSPSTGPSAFPVTANALFPSHSGPTGGAEGSDAFVAVFDASLATLEYCTYYGGSANDDGAALVLAAGGEVVLTGNTSSTDLPLSPTAFDATLADSIDAFVCAFTYDVNDSTLVYATYFGGSALVGAGYEGDRGRALALRPSDGAALFSGDTDVTDFPTTGLALVPAFAGGASDGFLALHRID